MHSRNRNFRSAIPSIVVGKANAAGAAGRRWLDSLDDIVTDLERDWKLAVREVMHGGSHAFVAIAERNGSEFVLKIEVPDTTEEEFLNGVRALQIANGGGYAKLYAFDVDRRAMLLERLGERLSTMSFSVRRQMEIICNALMKTWNLPACDVRLPNGADSIGWFRNFISQTWEQLGHPCPEKVIQRALEYLNSREANMNPDEFVMLHGDAHNNNTLLAPGSDEFKLIDPDGIFYEKAYDLGVLMREWQDEYAEFPMERGRERCTYLSMLTGVDERAVWEWGYLQSVSTGLILLQIGGREGGMRLLRTAEAWCV